MLYSSGLVNTSTELDTKGYLIYELVAAEGKTHFKLKANAPAGYVETVALGNSGATAVE